MDRQEDIVPTIRIFGPTSDGERALVYVHQVFPYFYIDYKGSLNKQDMDFYLESLKNSINLAMSISSGNKSLKTIVDIVPVRGIPFYGYHERFQCFLKIYFNNPSVQSRLITILESGAILSTKFLVYEGHVPFILQFLIDYNLYGMSFINLRNVKHRKGTLNVWDECLKIQPSSIMDLEMDTWPGEIQNRDLVKERDINTEACEPLVPSLATIWEDENRRRAVDGLEPLVPTGNFNFSGRMPCTPWRNDERLKQRFYEQVDRLEVDEPHEECPKELLRFPTAFQSISCLHSSFFENEFDSQSFLELDFSQMNNLSQIARQELELEEMESMTQKNLLDLGIIVDEDLLNQLSSQNSSSVDENEIIQLLEDQYNQNAEDEVLEIDDEIYDDLTPLPEPTPKKPRASVETFSQMAKSLRKEKLDFQDSLPQFDGPGDATKSKKRKRKKGIDWAGWNIEKKLKKYPVEKDDHSWLNDLRQSIRNTWSPVENRRMDTFPFFNDPPSPNSPTKVKVEQFNNANANPNVQSCIASSSDNIEFFPVYHENPTGFEIFSNPKKTNARFAYSLKPPEIHELLNTMDEHHLPSVVYPQPFFSNPKDKPLKPLEFGGVEFKFKNEIPAFKSTLPIPNTINHLNGSSSLPPIANGRWEYPLPAPSLCEITDWLNKPNANQKVNKITISQETGPTQTNEHGFKFQSSPPDDIERDFLRILSMEIHVKTDGDKLPNPAKDPICALFYCLQNEEEHLFPSSKRSGYHIGMITVKDEFKIKKAGIKGYLLDQVDDEKELIKLFCEKVEYWNPDMLIGYEIQGSSWGWVFERCQKLNIPFGELLSPLNSKEAKAHHDKFHDEWGAMKQSSLHVTGRIFLNVWRLMRKQLSLISYTLENIVYHVLHHRIPNFSHKQLTEWYDHGMLLRWRTLQYYLERVQYSCLLLDKTEIIQQTVEFARVYGMDFYSAIVRGSQFRVESVMLRISRPENFIMYSPNGQRISNMRALECIALNMEPISKLYTSPVAVLDFASLYPSIMIAYNFCFSTVIGKIDDLFSQGLGAHPNYCVNKLDLARIKHDVQISPNGVAFVKSNVRKGLLGRMLSEILETRAMVKKAMKRYQSNPRLTRILDAKQLGLKLLANVTYGYTAASFSGRMPCSEIADAIVQTARSTLEDSITFTNQKNHPVVYADTDSLFVSMPGSSKEEAFNIAYNLVDEITHRNPVPVQLKFEKIYLPCVLLAKKRYVGFKFESIHDEPVFDAKGIETVRRDGCPIVAKSVEVCLKILFRTMDLSKVKNYLCDLWTKILKGDTNLSDFIIAKEVKLGSYSKNGTLPPGALISVKQMEKDERAEPEYGERVPYVVIHRGPKHRLIDAVVSPQEYLKDPSLRLNGTYYIQKQIIPPLNRIFNLLGVDVSKWFAEMPKVYRVNMSVENKKSKTIDSFYSTVHCYVCRKKSSTDICHDCQENFSRSIQVLLSRVSNAESKYSAILTTCKTCTGHSSMIDADVACISLDCPIYFSRMKQKEEVRLGSKWIKAANEIDEKQKGLLEWF